MLSLSASASKNSIKIAFSSDKKDVGDAYVEIYKLKGYQYFKEEKEETYFYTGVATEFVDISPEYKLCSVSLGSDYTISINRYEDDGYDNLYSKYYVVRKGNIIKDGVFASDIDPLVNETPKLDTKSKKGLFGEDYDAYKDLNCSNVVLNFDFTGAIYPNEIVDSEGKSHELDAPDAEEAYSFVSNGKTYYFNKSRIDLFEKETKKYYALGANISTVLLSSVTDNEETYPMKMTYEGYTVDGNPQMGQNTSNKWGFEYYLACLEFLNYRHTVNNFENGYIGNYVLCNEIDFPYCFFQATDGPVALDVYAEEYSRLMRLANLASKKYYDGTTVSVSLTHNWGSSEKGSKAYAPLDLVEWFNNRSKTQGDYNWGLAPHCYGQSLPQNEIYKNDTYPGSTEGSKLFGLNGYPTNSNDHRATSMITFSNLEVLDVYLHQDNLKCDGQVRPVYLTESGISSHELSNYDQTDQRRSQAANIALAYYKVSQLESIKTFSYYRPVDHSVETVAGAFFGLMDVDNNKKQSYELWKYIDTQYSQKVANQYLDELCYYDTDNVFHDKGTISSYQQMLNLFDSNYDFSNFDWDKATPKAAECDEVLEFEDKIDLGDVKFLSQNFLYDGQEHTITYSGTLNDGITVSYENNTLTDFGSQEAIATFKKDGEVVGKRKATISVKHISVNKDTYNLNENIFVTTSKCDPNYSLGSGNSSSWVAIYKSDAEIGPDPSQYWYYDNVVADTYSRTKCIQEGTDNLRGGLPKGSYKIVYFKDSGYNYDPKDVVYIEILGDGRASGLEDLSSISFKDKEVKYEGSEISLEIAGTLPDGVSVRYENNTLNGEGKTNAIAIFEKDGVEIERRYALLTVLPSDTKNLITNKTTYNVGEDIMVTARGESGYWVAIYLKDDVVGTGEGTVTSLYWYYVIDSNHVSGGTYNIKTDSSSNINVRGGDTSVFDLPAGDYKIILFDNTGDGYHIAERVDITIVAAAE